MVAPSAICTSGVGIARGMARTMMPLTTTAASIDKTTPIVPMKLHRSQDPAIRDTRHSTAPARTVRVRENRD
jgi:hypothetical protein